MFSACEFARNLFRVGCNRKEVTQLEKGDSCCVTCLFLQNGSFSIRKSVIVCVHINNCNQ